MHIPGVLTRHDPAGKPVPVLLDSPHSGVLYPEDFQPVAPMETLRTGEDAFVHELFGGAPERGAVLIEAHFPGSTSIPTAPAPTSTPISCRTPGPSR